MEEALELKGEGARFFKVDMSHLSVSCVVRCSFFLVQSCLYGLVWSLLSSLCISSLVLSSLVLFCHVLSSCLVLSCRVFCFALLRDWLGLSCYCLVLARLLLPLSCLVMSCRLLLSCRVSGLTMRRGCLVLSSSCPVFTCYSNTISRPFQSNHRGRREISNPLSRSMKKRPQSFVRSHTDSLYHTIIVFLTNICNLRCCWRWCWRCLRCWCC